MPGGSHSTALPVPCPNCVDVTSVTKCGTSLYHVMKFISRDAEENMLLPHLVHGSWLAVSCTDSQVTAPVNYAISGALARL